MKASMEGDLVRRIMTGDRRAEEEFVQRFSRGVILMLRRKGARLSDIDDLYQDTFRIALQKIRQGEVREPEKISAFVCSLVRNLVIMDFRTTKKNESLDDPQWEGTMPVQPPEQLRELRRQEVVKIVHRVLVELRSQRDREVLHRYYVLEEDKERICSDLSLSSIHFNKVLFRARERFKELYKKIL
jgi:RNA polymerase sigma-70 factor (ECF subfamily)